MSLLLRNVDDGARPRIRAAIGGDNSPRRLRIPEVQQFPGADKIGKRFEVSARAFKSHSD